MQWQISALLALQVFGALAFNPLFLPLSKLTSKSHASVMHSLERKGKLVSSVRGLMEQSACRHPTRWRAPSLTIMAEAKDVICAPIWEAADAITLGMWKGLAVVKETSSLVALYGSFVDVRLLTGESVFIPDWKCLPFGVEAARFTLNFLSVRGRTQDQQGGARRRVC